MIWLLWLWPSPAWNPLTMFLIIMNFWYYLIQPPCHDHLLGRCPCGSLIYSLSFSESAIMEWMLLLADWWRSVWRVHAFTLSNAMHQSWHVDRESEPSGLYKQFSATTTWPLTFQWLEVQEHTMLIMIIELLLLCPWYVWHLRRPLFCFRFHIVNTWCLSRQSCRLVTLCSNSSTRVDTWKRSAPVLNFLW